MPNWLFIAIATPVMFLAGWAGHEMYAQNPNTAYGIALAAVPIWCGIVGHAVDSDRRARRRLPSGEGN